MASFLRMPGVSADSDEATLEEWSVSEGTEIHEGDVVATVETEKAVVEIASDRRPRKDGVRATLVQSQVANWSRWDTIECTTSSKRRA